MTREQTVNLIRQIVSYYPKWKPDNLTEIVNNWHGILKDFPEDVINGNLTRYVMSDKGMYPPNISNLIPKQNETYGFKSRVYSHEFYEEIEREVAENDGVY